MTRVPVSGIGVVAPGAVGIEAFRKLLSSGQTALTEVDRFDLTGLTAKRAGAIRDFKPKDFINPMKMRRMNQLSRLGVSAARLAIADSGVTLPPDTGVAIGTAFGPVQTSLEYMHDYVEKGAALAPPQLFAESVANAPGSHVAIEWGLRGFNITVTQRESSGLAAAMYAATQIVKGTVNQALIGGVEEVNEMIFSVLDRLGALSAGDARPFDHDRDGLSLGEGSAVLIAGAGGAKTYGWLGGFGMARDTTASISDWGTGHESVAAAMSSAIADAGLGLDDIDAVYASANGSRRGDALEAAALAHLFDDRLPPVVATKGIFGEYAAGGLLPLVAALLAIEGQQLHGSPGYARGDLEVVVTGRPQALRNILVNSLSAGGGVVCAVVCREDG